MSLTNFTVEVYEQIRTEWGSDPISRDAELSVLRILQDLMDEYETEIDELNQDVLSLERQIDALG